MFCTYNVLHFPPRFLFGTVAQINVSRHAQDRMQAFMQRPIATRIGTPWQFVMNLPCVNCYEISFVSSWLVSWVQTDRRNEFSACYRGSWTHMKNRAVNCRWSAQVFLFSELLFVPKSLMCLEMGVFSSWYFWAKCTSSVLCLIQRT